MQRRRLLATAAALTFGVPVLGELDRNGLLVADAGESEAIPPVRVGKSDVAALKALTREYRELARGGHPGMPEIYGSAVRRAELMLDADRICSPPRLWSALAQLHTDAGWYAYDLHLTDLANWHYARAIRAGRRRW
jgi:hypothetical protein